MDIVDKLTCAGGFPLPFFQFPLREAHIKNPNNKTVPEGVMQGLSWRLIYFEIINY